MGPSGLFVCMPRIFMLTGLIASILLSHLFKIRIAVITTFLVTSNLFSRDLKWLHSTSDELNAFVDRLQLQDLSLLGAFFSFFGSGQVIAISSLD